MGAMVMPVGLVRDAGFFENMGRHAQVGVLSGAAADEPRPNQEQGEQAQAHP